MSQRLLIAMSAVSSDIPLYLEKDHILTQLHGDITQTMLIYFSLFSFKYMH